MRLDSIKELIFEAEELYEIVSNHRKISKAKVKTIFEHLRSSLEYSIQDINNNLSLPKKNNKSEKVYFPFAGTLDGFEQNIDKNWPLIKQELPTVYDAMIDLHAFDNNQSWLKVLCDLSNHVKHIDSIEIHNDSEVINNASLSVNGNNIIEFDGPAALTNTIEFNGCTIGGKKLDDIIFKNGEIKTLKEGEISFDFRITKDRKIIVGDKQIDLLPFLDNALLRLKGFINTIYDIL